MWRVRILCRIEPHEYSEGIEKYSEQAYAETDQDIMIDVEAYTMRGAEDRVTRAIQSLVDKAR
jgi:hypothetical protein